MAPVTVSIIIIGLEHQHDYSRLATLFSSTVIIMVRYMDIIGLSFSMQPSLIIDWKRGSPEAHGLITCLLSQQQAKLSLMTQQPTASLHPNVWLFKKEDFRYGFTYRFRGRSRWNIMQMWTVKKEIKAQGMTFSETANVSALYRQQKHTQPHSHRHTEGRLRIYRDDKTSSDVLRCQSQQFTDRRYLNEPSRWPVCGSGEEPGD